MTIENAKIIDMMGINDTENEVVLTIVDHLNWDDESNNHLLLLQKKINEYILYIESGEIYKTYPKAKGRKIVIETLGSYPPSELGKKFYDSASTIAVRAGFELRFSVLSKERK